LSGRSHHCRGRWPPSSREERRKLSSREEAVVNIPLGHPCAPHHREHEPAARLAVLDLGEDAREASRHGRSSRTLGSRWPTAPPLARARRCRAMPRSICRHRASLALPPPRSCCRRYEHDTAMPHLAHAAAGMSTPPPCLTRTVAMVVARAVVMVTTTERDTPAACSRSPPPP
jgi:hypothetical protein